MIKIKLIAVLSVFTTFISLNASAQESTTASANNYNYVEAFKPNFYTQNGNTYRSASGKPGHQYWQNKADYVLNLSLNNEENKITGSENLTYTNNSPDELDFIWMSLDWNAKGLLNKFRTERFFTTVSGEGQPESYFKYFLLLLAGYFAWDWYRSKKKKKIAR